MKNLALIETKQGKLFAIAVAILAIGIGALSGTAWGSVIVIGIGFLASAITVAVKNNPDF